MAVIERDKAYGDFKAIERLNADRGLFRGECIRCGVQKKFLSEKLLEEPMHDCDDGIAAINQLRRTLKTDVESEEESADEDLIKSVFELDADVITSLLKELEQDGGDSARRFALTSLKMFMELIPIAERAYRSDPRQSNSFSLNALLANVRELINDLRVTEDTGKTVERVLQKNLHPAFLQVGQIHVDGMYGFFREIEPFIDISKRDKMQSIFNETIREMATKYQSLYYDVMKQVSRELE